MNDGCENIVIRTALILKEYMINTILIIGIGKLGSLLAGSLYGKIGRLWLLDSSPEAIASLPEEIKLNSEMYSKLDELTELPDIIIISVNDSAISKVQLELSVIFGKKLEGKLVIHCSGAMTVDILDDCRKAGAEIAAVHPYQTLFYQRNEVLEGVRWGVECSEESKESISQLISLIGGIPIYLNQIDAAKKALYHCSAVAASNFLTINLALASEIAQKANISAAEFFPPIIRTTIENNLEAILDNKPPPLTGPFARGDIETVKLHIEALRSEPALLKIYCYLSLAAAEISLRNGMLDENSHFQLSKLLKESII
ncbi:MAG: hypothetical protein QG635_571 [Bacteroidota bacterium]|nr:hypothetical protein [Bacteroidota bacterium]